MPLFQPILSRLEECMKDHNRARLRHRAIVVVAHDRVDRLAADTGWRPPVRLVYREASR